MNAQSIADRACCWVLSLAPDWFLERYSFLWPIPVGLTLGVVMAAIVFGALQLFGAR